MMDNFGFVSYEQFTEEEIYSNSSKLPYFRYEEIKKTISVLIEKYDIKKIPLDVFGLAKKLKINLVKYSQLTEYEMNQLEEYGISRNSDGFFALVVKKGKSIPYIYYNDKKSVERIRFTILHEIGHYILEHKQQSCLAEAEANFFAKYLIAPPILIHRINPSDYMEIAKIFKISEECAWYAFDYYQKWLYHHINIGFNYNAYEEKILAICSVEIPEL